MFLKKLNKELLHALATALMVYAQRNLSHHTTEIPAFPRSLMNYSGYQRVGTAYPPSNRRIGKEMWYIYQMEFFQPHRMK